jgi:hypothetical protein
MRHYPLAYLRVPEYLELVKPLPTSDEMARVDTVRQPFVAEGEPKPYMIDVVRAFRLLVGKTRYVEIGTFDKGCLAYVTSVLSPAATIIDVDVQANPDATAKLKHVAQPGQRLVTVVGDSTGSETLSQVRTALGGQKADCVFVDGNHAAPFCWADYANYSEFVADGGFMFFHDIYWQGAPECFGVSQAAEWIDRAQPMYVVFADHPVHRFFPWLVKGADIWGGVGIVKL